MRSNPRGIDMADDLFDYSRLHEVPDVPQFDLPRNVPKRGVSQRTSDLVGDRNVFDKVSAIVNEGKQMGGDRWYNAEPLRQEFVHHHGPDEGNKRFRKYMDFIAASSPRSAVPENIRNASYYYHLAATGKPMPAVGDKNPQPYGHMAQRLHQLNAQRVSGAGWDALNNPKPASFVENLVGNQRPATIDTHAFRLPAIMAQDPRFLETALQSSKDGPKRNFQREVESGQTSMADAVKQGSAWQAAPRDSEYGALEDFYRRIGKEQGLTTAQTQASAWVGGGRHTGLASDESKPFLRFLEDRIRLTAKKKNKDPKDVMKSFIRGEEPLFSTGGAAVEAKSKAKNIDRALALTSVYNRKHNRDA